MQPQLTTLLTTAAALVLASTTTALALPAPQTSTGSNSTTTTGGPPTHPYPTNTTIAYYQGGAGTAGTTDASFCAVAVAQGTLQSGFCQKLLVEAIALPRAVGADCSFTLWPGSQSCDGEERRVVALPGLKEGEEEGQMMCVGTGVLDGGKWQHASGVWLCG